MCRSGSPRSKCGLVEPVWAGWSLAAVFAPLVFFPISIYLGFPGIKKAAHAKGNRRARVAYRVALTASEPAAGAIWRGHRVISSQLGKVYEDCRAGQAAKSA